MANMTHSTKSDSAAKVHVSVANTKTDATKANASESSARDSNTAKSSTSEANTSIAKVDMSSMTSTDETYVWTRDNATTEQA